MCGRYVSISKLKAIEKRFNVTAPKPDLFAPNTNVSLGDFAPVITNKNPNQVDFFQFGFSPVWAKKQMYLFNARAEGDQNKSNDPKYSGAKAIITKPAFRQAIRSQRCLVIADAYLEGPEKEKLSKPYVVYLRNGQRPFAFAGLWDVWRNPETGVELNTFAIVTTVANSVTQKIGHHRSPVILHPEDEAAWLSNDLSLRDVTQLLQPFPGSEMNAYPISPVIKSPSINGTDLLKPIGERIFKEYDFEIYNEIELQGMGMTTARKRKIDDENLSIDLFS